MGSHSGAVTDSDELIPGRGFRVFVLTFATNYLDPSELFGRFEFYFNFSPI